MSGASKHSSFELDESLGILTPDQMAESPLCEEMPSLLLMSDDCYQEQEQDQDRYQEGYQGDGECSRPASPGGKPNPMTDSDFFTESDADMHEELQSALSGDRKAQVIDGRLYQQARCPSFLAAEEMDSSGVYSDTDRTPRAEREEFSPSKLSSMIMEQVNTIKNLVVSVPMEEEDDTGTGEAHVEAMQQESVADHPVLDELGSTELKEDTQHQLEAERSEHQEAKSPVTQQSRTPSREEDTSAPALKKHKMPKRNVVSKIKTMISSSTTSSAGKDKAAGAEERRKRNGGCSRWDAVMNKIAQGQAEAGQRPSLKQVKSRVFAGLQVPPPPPPQRKAIAVSQQTPLKAKSRRTRTRGSECSLQTPTNGKSHNSSRNSSISDLSKASPHSVRSKKRESGGRSRSPQSDNSTLSSAASRRPSTLPTTPPQRNGNGPASGGEVKTSNVRKSTSKRSLNSVNSKQQPLRDQNRVSGGGKTPEPSAPPVVSTSSPHDLPSPLDLPSSQSPSYEALLPHLQHASAGFEALGVLVNYLVDNLDAFSTPRLKNDLEKMKSDWLKTKLELEEAEVSCSRLQDELVQQKKNQEELVSQHMHQLASHQSQQQMQIAEIVRNHEETLSEMEKRLQEQAKVLRAQYDEELDHSKEMHKCELATAENALGALRQSAAEQLQRVQSDAAQRENELQQRLTAIETEHSDLKEQSRRFMESMNMDKDTKLQVTVNRCKELQDEVESLRTVLELRSSELQELRKQNEILQVDAELLPPTMQKLMTAQARVEDLEVQLERRTNAEKQLIQENRLLIESVHQESKQKKRLSQHNEELQWKLKQNSEVVNALVTDLSSKSNTMQVFAPQATCTPKRNTAEMLEFFISRNSMQQPCQNNEQSIVVTDCSPPQSPKVKGVIEKSDSVSWVLEMDESPEHVVNRLVRRAHSFRQAGSASPSPAHQSRTLPNPHKRQRSRMSQSLSASSSSLKGKKPARTRSFSADSDGSDVPRKWDDCDNVEIESTEGKSYSPIDRSDDNDDLIVVESVGDDMLSFIELESNNSVQNERMITGEISSSDSEGSIRSRRLEARDDLLLINRDDGLRERGILPKDAGGEAMISEETSDDEEDEEESRDSDVEGSGSLSGDEGSFSGSNSEFADGLCERKIKSELRQISKPVKKLSQLSSDALTLSGMDIVNWSEEAALPKALQSEG